MSAKQRVVVVGGGAAGHKIAYALQHAADVTLVDPKDYLEVPMAVPRLMVDPGSLPALIAYREFLPKAELVQGRLRRFARARSSSRQARSPERGRCTTTTSSSPPAPTTRAISSSR